MSESIDWEALTPAQRNALIAEKVMGLHVVYWPPQEHPEYNLRSGYVLPDMFGSPDVPRYSESMDVVWPVLLKLIGDFDRWSDSGPANEALYTFADVLLKYGDSYAGDEIYPALEVFAIIKTWTPERICHAALQAIEQEEKPK